MSARVSPDLPLGEVVSWKSPREVPFGSLQSALKTAGLNESLARDMLPRNAFRRAAKELADERIIKQTSESADEVFFQFTRESKIGDRFAYNYETVLAVNKSTGTITCPDGSANPALIAQATKLVSDKMGTRTASDITRIVQKIFNSQGDLFPIRDSGGVYFVPEAYAELVDKIEVMLEAIGGFVRGFKAHGGGGSAAGGDRTAKSVRESVRDGIDTIVQELKDSVDHFDPNTDSNLKAERMLERLQKARLKIAGYGDLLDDFKVTLKEAAEAAENELKRKIGLPVDTPDSPKEEEYTVEWLEDEEPDDVEQALVALGLR